MLLTKAIVVYELVVVLTLLIDYLRNTIDTETTEDSCSYQGIGFLSEKEQEIWGTNNSPRKGQEEESFQQ